MNPTDIDQWISEQLEIAERATKGPWTLGGCSGRMITTPSGYYGDGFIADVDTLDNATHIAHARTTVPRALRMLKVLRNALKSADLGLSSLLEDADLECREDEDCSHCMASQSKETINKALYYDGEEK